MTRTCHCVNQKLEILITLEVGIDLRFSPFLCARSLDPSSFGCGPSAKLRRIARRPLIRAPKTRPERLHVDELREAVRTIGLDRISEAEFVSVVTTAVILDFEHVNGGVEALSVAQYDNLPD